MMVGSYRGHLGGQASHTTSQLEAKPITVEVLFYQRMRKLGNGLLVPVQIYGTTFVKGVSK